MRTMIIGHHEAVLTRHSEGPDGSPPAPHSQGGQPLHAPAVHIDSHSLGFATTTQQLVRFRNLR